MSDRQASYATSPDLLYGLMQAAAAPVEAKKTLAVGTVVELKSGGPKMTVGNNTSGPAPCCYWFDVDNQFNEAYFPVEALTVIK